MSGMYISSLSPVATQRLQNCVNLTGMDEQHKAAYLSDPATRERITEVKVTIDEKKDEGEVLIKFGAETEARVRWSMTNIFIDEKSEFKTGSWEITSDRSSIYTSEIAYSENCADAGISEKASVSTKDDLNWIFSSIRPNATEQKVIDELGWVFGVLPDGPAQKAVWDTIERSKEMSKMSVAGELGIGLKILWRDLTNWL